MTHCRCLHRQNPLPFQWTIRNNELSLRMGGDSDDKCSNTEFEWPSAALDSGRAMKAAIRTQSNLKSVWACETGVCCVRSRSRRGPGVKPAKAEPRGLMVVSNASSADFLLLGWLDEPVDMESHSSTSCAGRVGCGMWDVGWVGQIAVAQWS